MAEQNGRENDLVLSPNEYTYVRDNTKGVVSCIVGSYKMSLSNSDSLVIFNERNKTFEESYLGDAIKTFVIAPENWYVVLKNPTVDGSHPQKGTSNMLPQLEEGKKVNIRGNVSFALFPGQMAKVIPGHRMHSNQYLLARVYDADALEKVEVEVPAEGTEYNEDGEALVTTTKQVNKYVVGQILVIKGSDVPFYIPPTGIEVLPIGGHGDEYVRDAVTLEELEYCILKNEQGELKYVHGAAVVFPEADEKFIINEETGDKKFNAIELSEISGIYVKVVKGYTEDGKTYKTGDELFITGKEQMIYFPRAEHTIIKYDGRTLHHAIAIPKGEGRYVLNRITGDIKKIEGPCMYLPDPRTSVIVQRKLSERECELWYPGNYKVSAYNDRLGKADDTEYEEAEMALYRKSAVSNRGIERSNKYTQPRTIILDNKLNGVVSIDVWTGYAVNLVSKNGNREVVVGPKTVLLDYDQTLDELILSTGKPKNTDDLIHTVYLKVSNNKVSDIIRVQTSDFVNVDIKVSYCVNFLEEYKDNWFAINNYVKYMCDHIRSMMKSEAKKYEIEEFYQNGYDIIRNLVIVDNVDEEGGVKQGLLFKENGMHVYDVEVLNVSICDSSVASLMEDYQYSVVRQNLELSSAKKKHDISEHIADIEEKNALTQATLADYKSKINYESKIADLERAIELHKKEEEENKRQKETELEFSKIDNQIFADELQRKVDEQNAELKFSAERRDVMIKSQESMTDSIKQIVATITPDLISALETSSKSDLLISLVEQMSPLAIAENTSVVDVTNKLLHGTSMEDSIASVLDKITSINKAVDRNLDLD